MLYPQTWPFRVLSCLGYIWPKAHNKTSTATGLSSFEASLGYEPPLIPVLFLQNITSGDVDKFEDRQRLALHHGPEPRAQSRPPDQALLNPSDIPSHKSLLFFEPCVNNKCTELHLVSCLVVYSKSKSFYLNSGRNTPCKLAVHWPLTSFPRLYK